LKALNQLLELVGDFPLQDPLDPTLQERIAAIRAKYKQVGCENYVASRIMLLVRTWFQVSSLLGMAHGKGQELSF
jgi:hypothetical protein